MTRVRENQNAQRTAEAVKKSENKKQGDKDAFNKMMEQKSQDQKNTSEQKGAKQTLSRGNASARLMAKQGMQAQKFSTMLEQRGNENIDRNKAQVDEKDSDAMQTENESKIDRKEDRKKDDKLGPVGEREQGSGGSGGGDMGGGAGDSNLGGQGSGAQGQGLSHMSSAAVTQAGANVPRISPEILKAMVDKVMMGVTPEGLHTMHIELKEGVMAGASIQVTADNGKISLNIFTHDKNIGRLLKASEGEISRAFDKKGMQLDALEVETVV